MNSKIIACNSKFDVKNSLELLFTSFFHTQMPLRPMFFSENFVLDVKKPCVSKTFWFLMCQPSPVKTAKCQLSWAWMYISIPMNNSLIFPSSAFSVVVALYMFNVCLTSSSMCVSLISIFVLFSSLLSFRFLFRFVSFHFLCFSCQPICLEIRKWAVYCSWLCCKMFGKG